jgi:hypothetical protein
MRRMALGGACCQGGCGIRSVAGGGSEVGSTEDEWIILI